MQETQVISAMEIVDQLRRRAKRRHPTYYKGSLVVGVKAEGDTVVLNTCTISPDDPHIIVLPLDEAAALL
jgi:hypothetical protein